MDELLMREVGALLEQGEFGAFAWANTLVGSGRTWCVLLYPQSGRAGQRTKKLAETLGLSDLYADPSEVADDVYTVADDETMVLATPHWSVVLARPQEVEDTGGAPRPDRALLLVGHGKGWPQWTRTEESLVRFLDRQRRASVSHGWIRLTRDGS